MYYVGIIVIVLFRVYHKFIDAGLKVIDGVENIFQFYYFHRYTHTQWDILGVTFSVSLVLWVICGLFLDYKFCLTSEEIFMFWRFVLTRERVCDKIAEHENLVFHGNSLATRFEM